MPEIIFEAFAHIAKFTIEIALEGRVYKVLYWIGALPFRVMTLGRFPRKGHDDFTTFEKLFYGAIGLIMLISIIIICVHYSTQRDFVS